MNKILVIHEEMTPHTGGSICLKRNIQSLKEVCGEENIFTININKINNTSSNSFYRKFVRYIGGYDPIKNKKIILQIEKTIIKENINIIWFDRSTTGSILKKIRKKFKDIKFITFFHNFEYKYFYYKYKNINPIRRYQYLNRIKKNELDALKCSNKTIVLTNEEKNNIEKFYKIKISNVIPISIADKLLPEKVFNTQKSKITNLLFVGSYFFGNVDGLKWFIKEILPFVACNLTIIGKDMEKLKNEISIDNEKVKILGFVEDLQKVYLNHDAVILPIITGAGMKVKVAEALMYGKYIIGTPSALEGYEITNTEASTFSTPEQFIEIIKNLSIPPYNISSRHLFLNKYSTKSTFNSFCSIINSLTNS